MSTRRYLSSGETVELIHQLEGGSFLVQRNMQYYDGQDTHYCEGELVIVGAVYARPPTAELDAEIATKHKILDDLEERTKKARATHLAEEEAAKKRTEWLKTQKPFEIIEELLTKKITHYVFRSYSLRIVTAEEVLKGQNIDYYHDKYKGKEVLGLRLMPFGDLKWVVYDGSSTHEVTPCFSLEEAKERAQAIINEIKEADEQIIAFADHFGLTVPDGWRDKIEARGRRSIEHEILRLETEIAKNRENLKKYEWKVAPQS